jgi:hypothetical protein
MKIVYVGFLVVAMFGMVVGLDAAKAEADSLAFVDDNTLGSVRAADCDCVFFDKVCGDQCVIEWNGGDDCTINAHCYPVNWWLSKCATGFTNQYQCDGDTVPHCDNQAETIHCGSLSICATYSFACVGGKCTCTSVGTCVNVPYVDCGDAQSCS